LQARALQARVVRVCVAGGVAMAADGTSGRDGVHTVSLGVAGISCARELIVAVLLRPCTCTGVAGIVHGARVAIVAYSPLRTPRSSAGRGRALQARVVRVCVAGGVAMAADGTSGRDGVHTVSLGVAGISCARELIVAVLLRPCTCTGVAGIVHGARVAIVAYSPLRTPRSSAGSGCALLALVAWVGGVGLIAYPADGTACGCAAAAGTADAMPMQAIGVIRARVTIALCRSAGSRG